MLPGKKARIGKTFASLLYHQITITQQIVSELEKLYSAPHLPKTGSASGSEFVGKYERDGETGMESICESDRYNIFTARTKRPAITISIGYARACFARATTCLVTTLRMEQAMAADWINFLSIRSRIAEVPLRRRCGFVVGYLRLSDENDKIDASALPGDLNDIVYVRLRRIERESQSVLSSEQNFYYSKAQASPRTLVKFI
ncbi:Hypothetical protein PHPALM_9222 [Phytophthora palmivora]|uniref:Uncharacterized protein n=1 Tax=Phytophthora palmivora TaxID=4796 RepID=A0A2P4Y7U1_9STRA|nr:Hypothetical protein PHPALM_9222 [Phytophthora palmivora]